LYEYKLYKGVKTSKVQLLLIPCHDYL
jgi:hypothetical protein